MLSALHALGQCDHLAAGVAEGVDRAHARGLARRRPEQVGQCLFAQARRAAEDLGIVARAIAVDLADRGAGEDIVELVGQDHAPQPAHFLGGVGPAAQRAAEGGQHLDVAQPQLAAAVVALRVCLGGVGAAVAFKVQFATPDQRILYVARSALEELRRCALIDAGQAVHIAHAPQAFEHFRCGSAAAIAVAEEQAALPRAVVVLEVAHVVEQLAHGGHAVVRVRRRKMRHHAAAVDALPAEGVGGDLVELVPGQLLGEEEVDARLAHDLGQLRGVAEDVRIPELVAAQTELLLKETLAVEKLAHQRFA